MSFDRVKKVCVLLGAATLISFSALSPLKAQSGGGDIAAILTQILDRVNNLPAALVNLGAYTAAWMNADDGKNSPTPALQGTFTQLGNLFTTDITTQNSLQSTLNTNLLSNDGSNAATFNTGSSASASSTPATPTTFPFANDLVYSSLLDAPFFAKDPRASGSQNKKVDSALNYIMNASGLNLAHVKPGNNWQGSPDSLQRYQAVYNTLMAATSFNGYALSNAYADKNQFTTLQQTLIQQATDPKNWFAQVSSENIGLVLRQLLLYQSQTFVLLSQTIQFQKQMVTAQAMNTAVLMAMNQTNERLLVSSAKGEKPSL